MQVFGAKQMFSQCPVRCKELAKKQKHDSAGGCLGSQGSESRWQCSIFNMRCWGNACSCVLVCTVRTHRVSHARCRPNLQRVMYTVSFSTIACAQKTVCGAGAVGPSFGVPCGQMYVKSTSSRAHFSAFVSSQSCTQVPVYVM